MPHTGPLAGVILMAYGAPGSLDEVGDFFAHIRGGRRPPEERIEELKSRYREIGDCTSLLRITARVARALEARLASDGGEPVRVFAGMRHSRPFIHEILREVGEAGVGRLVGLPLAPHYSSYSIGAYHRTLRQAAAGVAAPPDLLPVDHYHDHPGLIAAFAETLGESLEEARREATGPVRILFTAHSLPEKIVADGEPYVDQLMATSRLVAEAAGQSDWEFAFQSASPTGVPWLGPDLLDVVERLGREGRRAVLVAPVGFLADHLEVLYDVDILCRRVAEEAGIRLWRTPMQNARPAFVEALARIVRERLARQAGGGAGR
jgi:ferrochelatase